jgi:hypothetical protein
LNVAASRFNLKKSAPHVQTRDGVIDLGLNDKPLCLR